jgi:hypothetical protein
VGAVTEQLPSAVAVGVGCGGPQRRASTLVRHSHSCRGAAVWERWVGGRAGAGCASATQLYGTPLVAYAETTCVKCEAAQQRRRKMMARGRVDAAKLLAVVQVL